MLESKGDIPLGVLLFVTEIVLNQRPKIELSPIISLSGWSSSTLASLIDDYSLLHCTLVMIQSRCQGDICLIIDYCCLIGCP